MHILITRNKKKERLKGDHLLIPLTTTLKGVTLLSSRNNGRKELSSTTLAILEEKIKK